jgi:hypothetical protein
MLQQEGMRFATSDLDRSDDEAGQDPSLETRE